MHGTREVSPNRAVDPDRTRGLSVSVVSTHSHGCSSGWFWLTWCWKLVGGDIREDDPKAIEPSILHPDVSLLPLSQLFLLGLGDVDDLCVERWVLDLARSFSALVFRERCFVEKWDEASVARECLAFMAAVDVLSVDLRVSA